jgi:micrococcal nuclease
METDVCKVLVKQGYAWAYVKYLHDKELLELEPYAKTNQLGLWSQSKPIPPWTWRKKT